jgi:hypothetical protein
MHNQRLEGKHLLQVDEVVNIAEGAKERCAFASPAGPACCCGS